MSPTTNLVITLLLLVGMFLLAGLQAAYRRLLPRDLTLAEGQSRGMRVFKAMRAFLWPKLQLDATHFILLCTLNLLRFSYAVSVVTWLWAADLPPFHNPEVPPDLHEWIVSTCSLLGLFSLGFVLGDYLPKALATKYSRGVIRFTANLAMIYIIIAFPVSWPLYALSRRVVKLEGFPAPVGHEFLEMIEELNVTAKFDAHDKKLIESVVNFRHKLAKEVMVPRVDVFSLAGTTTIREAACLLDPEGYSRIPVYGDSIDEIQGVLMQKDVLRKYMESEAAGNSALLDAPIRSIVKDVIFTPETKRISLLLQEFRSKKVHLAIVVDEYGGTEGIVTIEDILEQIVGDIADEYDDEEALYVPKAEGGWVVDARMNILDVEEMLDITIPEEGDYDTLAGFVFHCAGSIPPKGFVIHRDNLELTVLSSNDRMVEKVWLKPTNPTEGQDIDSKND